MTLLCELRQVGLQKVELHTSIFRILTPNKRTRVAPTLDPKFLPRLIRQRPGRIPGGGQEDLGAGGDAAVQV